MIEKETVCIATDETKKQGYNVPNGFIGKYGYFFNQEQLNEYTQNVIKESLEIASEKATMLHENWNIGIDKGNKEIEFYRNSDKNTITIDKQSITNSFNEIYEKLKV